jgi:hypothetical protein
LAVCESSGRVHCQIDAWHVFVAAKNGCQAFLTCDNLVGVGPLVADASFVLVSRKTNQVLKPFFP